MAFKIEKKYNIISNDKDYNIIMEVGEVQRSLNQKVGSKSSGTVDFTLRFVIITESTNFKLKIY
jgi:hypothetical protein